MLLGLLQSSAWPKLELPKFITAQDALVFKG
jgi:hypothetical protein